jgi:hypothetical protein
VTALRALSIVAGGLIVFGTSMSVLATLVVPRGIGSRISVFVGRRIVRGIFLFVARRFDEYETKDRILALAAPISLLTTFAVWILLYLLAYALMIWGLGAGTFADALRESGSSLFTLGIASSRRAGPITVEFAAAATGLVIVALEIAYLPTIYGAFNRRETLVTMLESRAGIPAWGPEILVRHQLVGIIDNLPALYADWERWAADVDESHASHIVVASFRSPHPMRSWVVGLLAVLDSAALYNALAPERVPSEARLCLRMGFTCLRDIARVLGLEYDPDPLPTDSIQLTFDEFRVAVERLQEVHFPIERTAEEAWPHFKGWRINYEGIAYALADQTVAVPAPWSGPRTHVPGRYDPIRPPDRRPDDIEGKRVEYRRPPMP